MLWETTRPHQPHPHTQTSPKTKLSFISHNIPLRHFIKKLPCTSQKLNFPEKIKQHSFEKSSNTVGVYIYMAKCVNNYTAETKEKRDRDRERFGFFWVVLCLNVHIC